MTANDKSRFGIAAVLVAVLALAYAAFHTPRVSDERRSFIEQSTAVLVARYNSEHHTAVAIPNISYDYRGHTPAHHLWGGVAFNPVYAETAETTELLGTICHELAHQIVAHKVGEWHPDHADDGSPLFIKALKELRQDAGLPL